MDEYPISGDKAEFKALFLSIAQSNPIGFLLLFVLLAMMRQFNLIEIGINFFVMILSYFLKKIIDLSNFSEQFFYLVFFFLITVIFK